MKIWFPCLLLLGLGVPAEAQFGFPVIPGPPTPAAQPAVIPEAEVNSWLQNAKKASDEARAAQKNGDSAKRDAAILEAAKWIDKVCDPFGVTQAKRLEAAEIAGPLARDMAQWKTTFGDTKLTMTDVRLDTLIDNAKGQQKAHLLCYRADLEAAQDYGFRAFEYFTDVLGIPEAEPATVRYAIERGVNYIPRNEKREGKPLYDRMLTLTLTPAEKADWEMKRHLFVVDVEYQGDDFDKSMAAIKTVLYDPKTDLPRRNVLADAYQEHLFGDEKIAFLDQMIKDTATVPALQAKWYYQRGIAKVADSQWKEAVADYEQATQLAPSTSAEHDQYLQAATIVKLDRLEVKDGVQPALTALTKSPHLTAEDRFDAAMRLFRLSYDAKKFADAKAQLTQARTIVEGDLWKQAQVDANIALCQVSLNDVEGATQTWKAIPFDKLSNWNSDRTKLDILNFAVQTGLNLYQAAIKAKKWTPAQGVLDFAAQNNLYTLGDRQLMQANLQVEQGEFDKAIITLKALLVLATVDSDKATLNAMIANIEKMKATAKPAPATNG